MDSHGCLSSAFWIVRQSKWTVMAAWILSSELSVRINGQSWPAWVLSSALSVRTNGLTWLLGFCLLHCLSEQMDWHGCLLAFFSTRGSGGHNRQTLRHTSLSGTVASLPQSAPSQQADTPSHFFVRNCRFSSTKCTVTTGRHSVTLLCPELSLLFHKVHRHNRPTLRHTSLSGTVASPPQSTPSEQADTPSHFTVRNCRFSSTKYTVRTGRHSVTLHCPELSLLLHNVHQVHQSRWECPLSVEVWRVRVLLSLVTQRNCSLLSYRL